MRKKILYTSNSSRAFTGFGFHSKLFLKYFYSRKNPDGTPKYEVVEAAQGTEHNHPLTRANPWKTIGLVPSNDSYKEGQPRGEDGKYCDALERVVQYGGAMIEQVLKDERPNIFFGCEDLWGLQVLRKFSNRPYLPYYDCEWFDKFPCVIWTPCDSLPLSPQLLENAHKIPNLWMKASFAVEELHKKGHTHAELFPLLLDMSEYREFSEQEKVDNRKKYGIGEETIVFGFCSRNQNRKKFLTLLEGFKIFQDNNPGVDAKIILITNPFERGQWDIKRFLKEADINPESVLIPYLCHACEECELKPIREEVEDCRFCGMGKSVTCVNPGKGISEKQLIETYNLLNGYLQPADSGGFEAGCLEAMTVGIPLATVNYAYGESFVGSGEVFPIDFTFSFEIQSHFKKANPKSESIAEFMQLVRDQPQEMKERGQRGRVWAAKTFDPDIILKRIEDFIDSTEVSDYDFNFNTQKLNPEAAFPLAVEDGEFIKELIFNFWGERVDEQNPNFQTITHRLANGTTRQGIYQETQGMVLKQMGAKIFDPNEFFKDNGKKRLMWDMAGDVGDSLISLNVLDRLHEMYPEEEWDIYICCLPQYKQVYEHLGYIAGFVPYTGVKHFELWEGTRNHKKWVDVWISPQTWRGAIHNGADYQEFHKYSSNFRLTGAENVVK